MERNKERWDILQYLSPYYVRTPPNPPDQVEGTMGGSLLYPPIPDPERLDMNSQASPTAPLDDGSKGEDDLKVISPHKTRR